MNKYRLDVIEETGNPCHCIWMGTANNEIEAMVRVFEQLLFGEVRLLTRGGHTVELQVKNEDEGMWEKVSEIENKEWNHLVRDILKFKKGQYRF